MTFIGVMGKAGFFQALKFGERNPKTVIVDCANRCDPHSISSLVDVKDVDILSTELLYGFRDILRNVDFSNYTTIIVTEFHHLFNYQDGWENQRILSHCWEEMRRLSKTHPVLLLLHESYTENAARSCDRMVRCETMGHTVMSQRMAADKIVETLRSYGKSLRNDDRAIYEELLTAAYPHFGNISYANSAETWATVLLSIMLEMEKRNRNAHHRRLQTG